MDTCDVLVIGNGVLALSVAHVIAQAAPDRAVTILGWENRAWGASPASGAMLGCFGEVTALHRRSAQGRERIALSLQADALWDDWISQLNSSVPAGQRIKIRAGTFIIHNASSGRIDDANFDAIVHELSERSHRWEFVDSETIPGLRPAALSRPLRAVYLPDERCIDSSTLLWVLSEVLARAKNVTVATGRAIALSESSGRVSGATTVEGQFYSASVVVVAAGIGSQNLIDSLPELKWRIPRVFSGVGCSLRLDQAPEPVENVIRTPNRAFSCGLHVLPRDDGSVYVGATNDLSLLPESVPRVCDLNFLLDCATDQINHAFDRSHVLQVNVGNRPVPIDTFPIVGRTSIDGLFFLSGTYRDGLHMSPLLAQHIGGMVLGRDPLISDTFLPERPPIVAWTRDEAIEETAANFEAAAWEHEMKVPKVGWYDAFVERFRERAEKFYRAIESEFVVPPEFVMMADGNHDRWVPFFREYYARVSHEWPTRGLPKQNEETPDHAVNGTL